MLIADNNPINAVSYKNFLINEIHKNKFSTNIIETTIGGWLHVALIWDRQKKLVCLNT